MIVTVKSPEAGSAQEPDPPDSCAVNFRATQSKTKKVSRCDLGARNDVLCDYGTRAGGPEAVVSVQGVVSRDGPARAVLPLTAV